ncbi:hypothetical protein GQ53DRAFT_816601 [Thozetella sp. PMI_491]|nr:hypothetical protein GQ53DRAFT_816601 [Thozetella sp. PMI_491]
MTTPVSPLVGTPATTSAPSPAALTAKPTPLPPRSIPPSRSSSESSSASAANATSSTPPPTTGQSFQTVRPETDWNDLPEEMLAQNRATGGPGRSVLLQPPSATDSAASSRSSSTSRSKKKTRAYPAAAFGN